MTLRQRMKRLFRRKVVAPRQVTLTIHADANQAIGKLRAAEYVVDYLGRRKRGR